MRFSECSGCINGFCKGGYIIVVGVPLLRIGWVVVVFLMIDGINSFLLDSVGGDGCFKGDIYD